MVFKSEVTVISYAWEKVKELGEEIIKDFVQEKNGLYNEKITTELISGNYHILKVWIIYGANEYQTNFIKEMSLDKDGLTIIESSIPKKFKAASRLREMSVVTLMISEHGSLLIEGLIFHKGDVFRIQKFIGEEEIEDYLGKLKLMQRGGE